MKLIIDRFEAEWAVCEYAVGKTLDLPRALLPSDAREGDALCISIDRSATEEKKAYAEDLRQRLFRRK